MLAHSGGVDVVSSYVPLVPHAEMQESVYICNYTGSLAEHVDTDDWVVLSCGERHEMHFCAFCILKPHENLPIQKGNRIKTTLQEQKARASCKWV